MTIAAAPARHLLASSIAITALATALVAGSAGAAQPNGPDLVVKALSSPPSAAAAGTTFRVVGTVGNRGRSTARASMQRFYLSQDRRIGRSDVVIGRAWTRTLAPGTRSRRRVRLFVPAAVQPGVHRLAACADISRKVRERRERNNCRFARNRIRVMPAGPGSGALPGGALDRDRDGSPNSQDCGPDDPGVRPGAADKPDLDFVDRNCDGIDGDKARAIFLALSANGGSDANSGAFGQPKATLPAAIAAAKTATPVKDVYVALGAYPGLVTPVALANRTGVYGSYVPGFRSRSMTGQSSFVSLGTGATALSVEAVLQLVSFGGLSPGTGSVYGLRAVNSTLTLERVTLIAGTGGNGSSGADLTGRAPGGEDGTRGGPGAEKGGIEVFCATRLAPARGAGGNASDPMPVRRGGQGGLMGHGGDDGLRGRAGGGGALGGEGTPDGKGDWDTPSKHWGSPGGPGAQGADGVAGSPAFAASGYDPANGKAGTDGRPGGGGAGGGGGGGGTSGCDSFGGGGGGGGGGGLGGAGATGGTSGGGVFALYLSSTRVSARGSKFHAARGGNGGAGGKGQLGGLGGNGGRRSATHGAGNPYGADQDDGSNGGKGGHGGEGGTGGSGGGGAGGPSIGVLVVGGSAFSQTASDFAVASGGQGGPSPGGNNGLNGLSANVLQP